MTDGETSIQSGGGMVDATYGTGVEVTHTGSSPVLTTTNESGIPLGHNKSEV